MAFVFTLPPLIAPKVQETTGLSAVSSGVVPQLASPVMCQFFITGFHLIGLDIYNRRGADISLRDRAGFLSSEYGKTLVARMARIFFPFSIGAVMNKELRGFQPALPLPAVHWTTGSIPLGGVTALLSV